MKAGSPHKRVAGNNTRIGLASTVFAILAAGLPLAAAPTPTPDNRSRSGELAALRVAENRAKGAAGLAAVERGYGSVLERSPQDATARAAYAEFLARQGRARDAASEIGRAARDKPDDAALAHRNGNLQLAAGNVRLAVEAMDRAAQLAPSSAGYRFDQANFYYLFRRDLAGIVAPTAEAVLQTALRKFNEAAEIEPENADYWLAYAETFYTLESADWMEARRAWLRYHDLTPHKEFARVHLLRTSIRGGDRKEALRWAATLPAGSSVGTKLRLQAEALPDP